MTQRTSKYIFANWKANKSLVEARNWAKTYQKIKKESSQTIAVFPSFPVLSSLLQEFPDLTWGAQDCSEYEAGAYTGEVPTQLLRSLGAKYVLLGHSERRKYQKETSVLVARKVELALAAELTPVICLDRDEFATQLNQLDKASIEKSIFAYEPVHAISSFGGHEDPLETTVQTIQQLREMAESNIAVLYGGSVDAENSFTYLSHKDIDGVLVGKSSLDPELFAKL